jgi:MFS family permease
MGPGVVRATRTLAPVRIPLGMADRPAEDLRFSASIVYGLALFVIAIASNFNGFLVGMAISGLGFGMYFAVDLALVLDVLPATDTAAKDLGVFNMASAVPFSIAPAIAPAILAIGTRSYGVLYAVAGLCAIVGAFAILPVKRVR